MMPDQCDLDFCASITRRGGSNLWLVSRALPKAKRSLFAATYASMRFIDDYVDDEYQLLCEHERISKQAEALSVLESWKAQARQAITGSASDLDPHHAIAPVFRAMAATVGNSDLGERPWLALSAAMHSDIQNSPLETWDDFYGYAEGATVAPTAVYLYILLCKNEGSEYQLDLESDLFDLAREMAIFCYLVHIIRDLCKDAAGGGRLLTVPRELLSDIKQSDGPMLEKACRSLLERADHHRLKMEQAKADSRQLMKSREKLVFDGLLGIYLSMHNQMRENPLASLQSNSETLEAQARKALGLTP
ncbi:phytoene/squalene synthase family protein [Aestuariispira insulae]|uniref:Phytoene synthase n=1 Tax=Aestuariispira insulae TaxID=1461337 RepID=A0A3D9HNJ6_9PROT|nr:squalene/phytoene synthase family protein [Aestuariispira insulae]RED51048.1 phytoene synthase [Aestuariispira insulae]